MRLLNGVMSPLLLVRFYRLVMRCACVETENMISAAVLFAVGCYAAVHAFSKAGNMLWSSSTVPSVQVAVPYYSINNMSRTVVYIQVYQYCLTVLWKFMGTVCTSITLSVWRMILCFVCYKLSNSCSDPPSFGNSWVLLVYHFGE